MNLWLVVIVSVFALSFWFGKDLLPSGEATSVTTGAQSGVDVSEPEAAEPMVHLLVLNGTAESGLAREFGLLLGRAGWVAADVGNASHDHYTHSFLVNRQLSAARATRLANELGGLPVLREYDGRSNADAVLVLGRDADQLRSHLVRRSGM